MIKSDTIKYMPQLNAVRAIAVTLVIISHWLVGIKFPPLHFLPNAELGVMLFFVLSGFLITRILLLYRSQLTKEKNKRFYLKKFFGRRALRIFPIYYLTILAVSILLPDVIKGSTWWHISYLSNVYFALIIKSWQGGISHFWSLAVEEQFYLIWPFIILFSPKKALLPAIILIILSGPLFRSFSDGNELFKYLTPGCFDALGMGSLLALKFNWISTWLTNKIWLILTGTSFFLMIYFFHNDYKLSVISNRFAVSLFCTLIIFKAAVGFSGVISKILAFSIITYIGRISYGLYLFHNLIPFYYIENMPMIASYFLRFTLLISIASISFFAIETPFLKLKTLFN